MIHNRSTFISTEIQTLLRADTALGCGNFLDKCNELNPNSDVEFIFLEVPFILPDGSEYKAFSLKTLIEARNTLARWYVSLGVAPGDIITLFISNGINPFLHYLALISLGACASIINPAMSMAMAKAYIQQNNFNRVVVDDAILKETAIAENINCELINYSGANSVDLAALPKNWPYKHEDTTLVMLSHTSGTTGVSKAVRFEHRQFFMGKRSRIGQFAESTSERFLTALPSSHSSAISHLETATTQGIPTYVMSNSVGEPVRKVIEEFRPTMVAGFPQTYTSLVQSGVSEGEFSSVKRWFSMGDAAHEDHIRRILTGAPMSTFCDSFGSSELGMALFRKTSTLDNISPRRCVGRPVEIAVARILDFETDEELGGGQIGLLAVRAPTITPGYWKRPELTAKAWRSGYFLTGDVGFCRDGDFYLIDRAADVIKSSTGRLYSLWLEEAAQQIPGICDVSVVGIDDKSSGHDNLFALVLLDHGYSARAQELGSRVIDVLLKASENNNKSITPGEIAIAVTDKIENFPLGATGKVLKRQLRESYQYLFDTGYSKAHSQSEVLYVAKGIDVEAHLEPAV